MTILQTEASCSCLSGKTVAVWGWYAYGNFGDDLMAVLVARQLKQRNASPRVFGLLDSIAQAEGIETASSLSELLDGADGCVFGGGGLLLDDPELDDMIGDVVQKLEAREIPFCVLSVGGSGSPNLDDDGFRGRSALLRSKGFCGGSRRLPFPMSSPRHQQPDKERLEYIPDMVLTSGDLAAASAFNRSEGPLRLGVNLPAWEGWEWIMNVLRLLEKSGRVQLVYVPTLHDDASLDYERSPGWAKKPGRSLRYQCPSQLIAQLGQLDGVVSYKLHLGVTALALGVPFLSVGGQPKTVEFMQSVGLQGWLCRNSRRDAFKLVRSVLSLRTTSTRKRIDSLQTARDQAQGHWNILSSLCDHRWGSDVDPALESVG